MLLPTSEHSITSEDLHLRVLRFGQEMKNQIQSWKVIKFSSQSILIEVKFLDAVEISKY